MKIFNFLLTLIFGINYIGLTPQAFAVKKDTVEKYQDKVQKQNLQNVYSKTKSAYSFKDRSEKTFSNFKRTPPAELAKHSPKEMNKMLAVLKSAQPFNTAIRTTIKFPIEAFIFATAVGAVIYAEMMLAYENNPMGMETHVHHQLSPLGAFGFWSFMFMNGISHNMLRTLVRNPKFHMFVTPYLGMTTGFFTQSFLTQIMSNPKFQLCVESEVRKTAEQKQVKEPCEDAYKEIVESELLYELAPGLISMLSSTAAAALVQYGVTKGYKALQDAKMLASISFNFIPGGGFGVQGLKFALKQGSQIGLFYAFDVYFLNKMITTPWKNHFESNDIVELEQMLQEKVNDLNNNYWSSTSTLKLLSKNITAFGAELSNWRQVNLLDIHTSHQAWLDKVNKLSMAYDVSYSYYQDLISELEKENQSRIFREYPYFGVKADGLNNDLHYLTRPDFVKSLQEDSINNLVSLIDNNLKSNYYKNLGFSEFETSAFKKVYSLLKSNDLKTKLQGLKMVAALNDTTSQTFQYFFPNQGFNYYAAATIEMHSLKAKAKTVLSEMAKMQEIVGKPDPKFETGEGYIANYMNYSGDTEAIKQLAYPSTKGIVRINNYLEYLTAQMICGPDIRGPESESRDKVLKESFGWSVEFIPPSIVERRPIITGPDAKPQWYCKGPSLSPTNTIYKTTVKGWPSAFEYIQNNLIVELKDAVNFSDWWNRKTEPEMIHAFKGYEAEYYKLVLKMLGKIYNNQKSSWNNSNISNGAIASIFQETRLYTKLLAELFKATHQNVYGKALPNKFLSSEVEKNQQLLNIPSNYTSTLPMHFEKQIEYEMARINWEIRNIKYNTNKDGTILVHKGVDLTAIKKNIENAKNIIDQVNTEMKAMIKFTPAQDELIKTLNEAIHSSVNQLALYGEMVASMNWSNRREMSDEQAKIIEKFKQMLSGSLANAGKK